jgi:hypothetical protein
VVGEAEDGTGRPPGMIGISGRISHIAEPAARVFQYLYVKRIGDDSEVMR